MGYCTSEAILYKAGKNVNTLASTSQAMLARIMADTDAFINVATRHDWNSEPPTSPYLAILADIASDLSAVHFIAYDMSGYTGRGEAESMINVLHDRAMRGINLLKEEKVKETIT